MEAEEMKVLIVEGNPHLGWVWQRHLERHGCDVVLAHDQSEAIETLRDIHRQMVAIAAEHKADDGLIKDPAANAAFNRLNSEAEGVIQSFPRLG